MIKYKNRVKEKITTLYNHKLIKNSISLTFIQFFNIIAPLIILPYLTRVLGVQEFGLVMLLYSANAICCVITDFGLTNYATYIIAKNTKNKNYINRLITNIFLLKFLIVIILSFSIYIVVKNYLSITSDLIILGFILNVIFQSFIPVWLFHGIEKVKDIAYSFVIGRIIYVILVYIFVKNSEDTYLVFFLFGISNAISALIAIKSIYSNDYRFVSPSLRKTWYLTKSTFPYFISCFFTASYTSANTFLVGTFGGLRQSAIYGASEKIYQASTTVTAIISQALFPYMSRTNNKSLFKKIILMSGILFSITISLLIMYAEVILVVIFGGDYANEAGILKVLLVVTVINFFSVNYGYPAFAGINKLMFVNYSVFLGAVIQSICFYYLYSKLSISAMNMSLTVLISETFVLIFRIYFYNYYKIQIKKV